MLIKIKEPVFEFPEMIKPASEGNWARWEFEGSPTDIVHVRTLCGCTASWQLVGQFIEADFHELETDKGVDLNSPEYEQGYIPFEKGLIVYLNDGLPLKEDNAQGQYTYSDRKQQINISFKGKIDLATIKERYENNHLEA